MVSESQYQCSFCSLSSPHADVQTDMTDDRYLCPTLSWKLICHVKLWYCLPDTFIIHFTTLKWLLISTETISLASALALISEKVPAEISDQLENESVGSNLNTADWMFPKISPTLWCVITSWRYQKECAPSVFTQWESLCCWYFEWI